MSKYRAEQLGDEIRTRLGALIPTLKDPRIRGVISVTRVEASGDMQTAKVYISALSDAPIQEIMRGFRSSAGYLRRELAASLQLRHTPELIFLEDRGIARGQKTLDILKNLPDVQEAAGGADEIEI